MKIFATARNIYQIIRRKLNNELKLFTQACNELSHKFQFAFENLLARLTFILSNIAESPVLSRWKLA